MRQLRLSGFLASILSLSTIPAVAETPNFGTFTLSPGYPASAGVGPGHTGGSSSLPDIVAKSDRFNKPCLGYADPTPDHIMILEKDFSQLLVQVNSGGNDTTLLIQGPDNTTIRCGDDTDGSPDASVQDTNWKAGTYRIWVGSMEAGVNRNYSLSVRE